MATPNPVSPPRSPLGAQNHWRKVWLGVASINLATGLVMGLSLAILFENFWWLLWSCVAGLLFGGAVIMALVGTSRIWHGIILALLYFGSVVIIYPIGQAAERWMPPQPNLPHHASTYILLWPVALLLAGTLRLFVAFTSSLNRRSKLPRFVPIMAALSVIILGTLRPIPPGPSQPEWRQPSPMVGGSTLDEFSIVPLVADGRGGVWFAYKKVTGRGGVGHLKPKTLGQNEWQIYPAQSNNDEPNLDFALSLLSDGHQGIWVGSLKGGLSHYDAQTATWQAVTNFNSDVLAMTTAGGNLWLATFGDGVLSYDPATQHWQAYTRANTGGGLQDDQITVIVADAAGGLWAGTYGGGLSRYHPTEHTWQAFTAGSTGGGLASDDVRTVVIDETGYVWVGTFGGGISRYHPLRNSWDLYTTQTTNGDLVSNYVLTLLSGRNGQMWAGLSNLHDQGGLAYFDGNRWQSYTTASTHGMLRSDDVRVLALDDDDGLWIGTRDGGLSHLAADHETWASFTVKSTHGGLADDTVLALLPAGVGRVWIGTGSGLRYLRWH